MNDTLDVLSESEALETRLLDSTPTDKYAHLDKAELGWFHLRAVIVSGVGFFADAYDIFVVSLAIPMIYQ